MKLEQAFWSWFSENEARFYFIDNLEDSVEKESLLAELFDRLQAYSEGLYFLIGGHPHGVKELIITAEGNTEFFADVENLVHAAPKFENWKLIAFKPQTDLDFTTAHNDLTLDPKNMSFLPLENGDSPNELGLRLSFSPYDGKRAEEYKFIANIILDNVLGEKIFASSVHYMETSELPPDFDSEGYMPLEELPAYVDWLTRRNSNQALPK